MNKMTKSQDKLVTNQPFKQHYIWCT